MSKILLKRIYSDFDKADGYRILVDRLWPRGIKKENAHIDLWLKEIAPTTELRKWFNHDTEKWADFQKKYFEEIKNNPDEAVKLITAIKEHQTVTLLFGAKDEAHNQAIVLKNWIEKRLK